MKYYAFLTFAFALLGGMVACSWPVIAPAVHLAFLFIILVGALSGGVSISVLFIGFSFWRVREAKASAQIAESASVFAAEFSSPIIRTDTKTENLWLKGYLDLGWLGSTLGTLSLERMRPYFKDNAQRLWTHMVNQLKAKGYAKVETRYTDGGRPYKVTVWVGSYRAFFRRMMTGDLVLAPCPRMAPPVISTGMPQVETTETTEMPETMETTRGVYRG